MSAQSENKIVEAHAASKPGKWLKKGGLLLFFFFLLKGIGWLVLIYLVAMGLMDENTVESIKEAIPFF